MYCFFDPPSTFFRFSVQNCGSRPINHMVILRCMVNQCWFVLLRQTWCSGKRFTSYGLHLRLIIAALRSRFRHSILQLWFLVLPFFLAYSQRWQIGCLSYFHTWSGLSANLECRFEMRCAQLAENTERKNYAKNRRLRTTAQLCN